jgi:hypothetical protein
MTYPKENILPELVSSNPWSDGLNKVKKRRD